MPTTGKKPFSQLFVGVAEDGRSDVAVRMAFRLAETFGARTELVHAVPIRTAGWRRLDTLSAGTGAAETLTRAWEVVGDHLRRSFGERSFEGRSIETYLRVLPGHPAQLLLERALATEEGLIVLGAHRRHGALDFGSTARAILAKAPVPVWVQTQEPRDVRRILVPVDLAEHDAGLLGLAAALARTFDARVQVMSCFLPPTLAYPSAEQRTRLEPTYVVDDLRRAAREELEETVTSFAWEGIEHETLFLDGDPTREILARQDDCDLIVMGTHGRTRLAAAVLGSTAYGVLKDARTPVVVVRDERKDWLL